MANPTPTRRAEGPLTNTILDRETRFRPSGVSSTCSPRPPSPASGERSRTGRSQLPWAALGPPFGGLPLAAPSPPPVDVLSHVLPALSRPRGLSPRSSPSWPTPTLQRLAPTYPPLLRTDVLACTSCKLAIDLVSPGLIVRGHGERQPGFGRSERAPHRRPSSVARPMAGDLNLMTPTGFLVAS